MYFPLKDIAYPEGNRVAVAASNAIFGSNGSIVIAVMIMISTFGCNNGLIAWQGPVCIIRWPMMGCSSKKIWNAQ